MSSMQKKSLIATAAIFCCRFTGLIREITYQSLFGATGAMDAFLAAFRLPNMLRDMFAEGALSQSFTSAMSKVEKVDGPKAAWELANKVFSQLIALMVILVAGGVLIAGYCMQQIYPERVLVHYSCSEGSAAPVPGALVEFLGTTRSDDGLAVASFSGKAPLDGLTDESCLKEGALRTLSPGDTLYLYTGSAGSPAVAPAGSIPDGLTTLKVEPRGFMELATDLCRIMWPFILFASVSALCMGALNVFGIFGLPNLASAAFNLTIIFIGTGLGWLIDPQFGPNALYGFAVAVVLGGLMQILVQLPKMRQKGFRPRWNLALSLRGWRISFTDPVVRKVWYLIIPGVIAAGITQSNVFINTAFAMDLAGGSVTAISAAFHLWQLPVALFGVAVGMVVLPAVSRMTITSGENNAIPEHLARSMRFVAFFAVPSTVFLGIWAEPIVSTFYQRGRFDAEAAVLTGNVLACYSVGLLCYAGMKVLQPIFLALEKPWAPAGLAIAAFCISVGLNYVFVYVLHFSAPWLALTTSVVTILNFFFYFFYLRHLLGNMACGVLLPGLLRILLAGAVLALACWQIRELLLTGFTSWSFIHRLGAMAIGGIVGALIYLAAAFLFRVPELDAFTRKFLRRRA